MGLSFAGPAAPPPRRPRLLHRAARLLLAGAFSCALTSLAIVAMFLTTEPPWLSYLLEPFSFLLLPGLLIEGIPRNPYFFSMRGVVFISVLFYFLLFAHFLRPRPYPSSRPTR